MVWCVNRCGVVLRAAVLAGLWAGCLLADESADPDVASLFARHPDAAWAPLAEKWASTRASMTSPVENLILPLDAYPNGRTRALLRAKRAQIFMDGKIFAEGVVVELSDEEGRPDGHLMAEGCLFDRNTKCGYCEGWVNVEKSGDQLKGRGMYFSIEGQFIKILADCEIRTHRIRNNFGRL